MSNNERIRTQVIKVSWGWVCISELLLWPRMVRWDSNTNSSKCWWATNEFSPYVLTTNSFAKLNIKQEGLSILMATWKMWVYKKEGNSWKTMIRKWQTLIRTKLTGRACIPLSRKRQVNQRNLMKLELLTFLQTNSPTPRMGLIHWWINMLKWESKLPINLVGIPPQATQRPMDDSTTITNQNNQPAPHPNQSWALQVWSPFSGKPSTAAMAKSALSLALS